MKKIVLFLCMTAMVFPILVGCHVGTGTGAPLFSQTKELLKYDEQAEVNSIAILNGAGQIHVTQSKTDNIEVICHVEYSGTSKSDFEKKTEPLVLTPQITDGTLYLEAISNEINYWEWLDQNLNVDYVKINYDIKVPLTVNSIRAVNVVGETEITDVSCGLYLRTYVGNVKCLKVKPIGNSNILVATGNIKFSSSDISRAQIIANGVGVGNIECTLPKNASYTTDNTIVPDTAFSVDRSKQFSSDIIQEYREMLTDAFVIDDNSNETLVGNVANLGSVKIK